MDGFLCDCRRRFSVITVWGISRSQRFTGKLVSTPARFAIMKWLLNIWIAAWFLRWVSGGTSCRLQSCQIAALNASDASLSNICKFGLIFRPRWCLVPITFDMQQSSADLHGFWLVRRWYNLHQCRSTPWAMCFLCLTVLETALFDRWIPSHLCWWLWPIYFAWW